MKYTKLFLLMFIFLASCATPATPVPTQVVTVEPSQTPRPTSTLEPSPTLEPSATPIAYPDVLNQTFSNITVFYRDDFNFSISGQSPKGWVSTRDAALQPGLRETKEDNFKITASDKVPGILFHYADEVIEPGEGVFFTFQYTGAGDIFTWGLDNLDVNGEFLPFKTDGYYSFAMQMLGTYLAAHVIEGPYLKDNDFTGDLKLEADHWYNITIAFDKSDNYIIKIWEPDSPENQLVYVRNWPNSPDKYYFISWMSSTRTLWMDDFTIFSFDKLIQ